MKKVKMILYIIIVLWIGVLTQTGVRVLFQDEGRMIDAFANTNSSIVESKVEIAADYGTRYLAEEDKKDLIQYIFAAAGINEDYNVTLQRGKKTVTVKGEKKSKNGEVSIELISLEKENEENEKQVKHYILVSLGIYSDNESILKYKELLEKAIKSVEVVSIQSVIKMNGVYTGNLTLEEKNKITDQLLSNLQAECISENRKDDLYTVSGYTGLIPEYITQEGRKVNINIVMNYDESKDKTNICLASPIINEDY